MATDSGAIATAVEKAGGRAVLTRSDHASGSDRIAEAADIVDPERKAELIVNIQGDRPTQAPHEIRAALDLMDDPAVDIGTIAAVITKEAEKTDPNVVKAIGTPIGPNRLRSLYFTRATAPSGDGPLYFHMGLYVYRRAALAKFVALPPSPLEQRERLEQLRALEAGMRIDIAVVQSDPLDVNTPEDLEAARKVLGR
ncbi:3-deoxy-manno-octulosonate cytidylyltransferase (CMP-KDO synthetase) [Variibacter gotjawalensis]|nr:3-deoxy-manno-octulosonate cytidylyltransferase (CMP-KDO synthetase) [Variibacter gotjawalensis]